MELKDKKIIIVGLGREGFAAYTFLRQKFGTQQLAVADQATLDMLSTDVQSMIKNDANLDTFFNKDYLSSLKNYDVIIKTAGIPLKVIKPYIGNAIVSSPTQLFFDSCPGTIIGVTGTKGKSTTTTVIYEVIKSDYANTILCGNIGISALEQLPKINDKTLVVMELSSHQLQTLTKSPHIAVLQNITPEHLDYYDDFEDYVKAKENIASHQSPNDYFLYNANYPIPYEIAQRSKAKRFPFNADIGPNCCFIQGKDIMFRFHNNVENIMGRDEISLLGDHNIQNVLPAIIIGKLYEIPTEKIVSAIAAFKGLEDRLELVGDVNGVTYYNDSISTTPESAIAAIDALAPDVETIIVGGYDRGLDYTSLAKRIVESEIKTVILLPTTGRKIEDAIKKVPGFKLHASKIRFFNQDSMAGAVEVASEHTSKGKICLLSPAAPSFNLFKDYHERALQFKEAIAHLHEK